MPHELANCRGQFEDKAIKGKDPVAQAVVILRNELKEDIKELKKLKEGLSQYKDNLRKVEQILIGIAFVILIAWISSFLFVFYDLIKEKDLFLKYDKMYENYNQRYLEMINKVYRLELEINNTKKSQ